MGAPDHTPAAGTAAGARELVPGLADIVHALGAGGDAGPAGLTPVAQEYKFRLGRQRLRAVAPPAGERAALEVDGHADAGSVVHGEGVDVEHQTLGVRGLRAARHWRPSWRRMWCSCCSWLSIVK